MKELLSVINQLELARGKYVLYWMHHAKRVADNPALLHAVKRANEMKLPLITLFIITPNIPEANFRHYRFMLEGFTETYAELSKLDIEAVFALGNVPQVVTAFARNAVLLVSDKSCLKMQSQWLKEISETVDCRMETLETEAVFAIDTLMQKEAFNAKSIRTRMHKMLPHVPVYPEVPEKAQHKLSRNEVSKILNTCPEINTISPDILLEYQTGSQLHELVFKVIPTNVGPATFYQGGHKEALSRIRYFADEILPDFQKKRNEPGFDYQSRLSPYLHFGQVSVREIVRMLMRKLSLPPVEVVDLIRNFKPGTHPDEAVNGILEFFEEAVVRRELSMNYCHFNPDYDQYSSLPAWARTSLREHISDTRPYIYTPDALEQAATHDQYWNAAQKEMVITGKMHGYMRMYWCKKIIEWTEEPEDAFQIALHLNNKYELDGRDPNSFAGVAWCFGKHDRAWPAFPIFGKVRTMTATGLSRKFDMNSYLKRISLI